MVSSFCTRRKRRAKPGATGQEQAKSHGKTREFASCEMRPAMLARSHSHCLPPARGSLAPRQGCSFTLSQPWRTPTTGLLLLSPATLKEEGIHVIGRPPSLINCESFSSLRLDLIVEPSWHRTTMIGNNCCTSRFFRPLLPMTTTIIPTVLRAVRTWYFLDGFCAVQGQHHAPE